MSIYVGRVLNRNEIPKSWVPVTEGKSTWESMARLKRAEVIHVNRKHMHYTVRFLFDNGKSYLQTFKAKEADFYGTA
jgi:hypothetical protein